jgi:site-specific recombinase XerD
LWDKTIAYLDELCSEPFTSQLRAARAAILLMGESGLRRSEAANAWVSKLRPTDSPELWRLDVLGKRNKWRMVPVSQRTYLALQAHWADLENRDDPARAALPFSPDNEESKLALIRPLRIPQTPTATNRHRDCVNGYSIGGLATLVVSTLKKMADSGPFSAHEATKLRNTSAHAFRHTFGTTTIAQGLPHDVLQKILGHVSLATTSIYVQAEQQRILDESAKVFANR